MKATRSHNFINRVGFRYGKLVVKEFIKLGAPPRYESVWLCECDCGREEERRTGSLKTTCLPVRCAQQRIKNTQS